MGEAGVGAVGNGSTENPAAKRRVGWIDIARGIGIALIIIGHLGIVDPLVHFAFSVHVPLFLMISGYLFRPGRSGATGRYAKRLLIPYLSAGVAGVGVMFIRTWLEEGLEKAPGVAAEWFAALLFGSGTRESFFFGIHKIGAIWFLLALFLAQIMYERICGKSYAWPAVVILFAAGFLSSTLIWLPWSVQAACVSLLFIHLGHEAHNHGFDPEKIGIVPLVASAAIWVAALYFDQGEMYIVTCHFRFFPLDIAGAVAGTVVICWFSVLLDRWGKLARPLRFMGRNSLCILCFHFIAGKLFDWYPIVMALGLGFGKKAFLFILFAELAWANIMTLVCTRVNLLSTLFGAVPSSVDSGGRK